MMALNYVCIAFLMLYLSGDAMANTDCMKTPWSDMCTPECDREAKDWVKLNCTNATLPALSYDEEPPEVRGVEFLTIEKVSAYAFKGYRCDDLYLKNDVTMIENDAFNGLEVRILSIEDNKNLETLPSKVFNGVVGVTKLRIAANSIKALPGDIFKGLDGVTDLRIIEPSLSCLAYNIFRYFKKIKLVELGNVDGMYAIIVKEKPIQGICSQTFRNITANLQYEFALDKCAIECSSDMSFNNFIDATKMCDCDKSIDGCVDSNCTAITRDAIDGMDGKMDGMDGDKDRDDDGDDDDMDSGSPGSNPGIGYLMTFVASAIFWMVTGFQV